MFSTFRKIFDLLSPRERRGMFFLLLMIFTMALLDAVGVASILPFIAVLANPNQVESNAVLVFLQKHFGFNDNKEFLFFLGSLMFVLLLLSIAFKTVTTYAQLRFALMREHSIGKRMFEGYLNQPYSWFLNRNSAELGKTILSEINNLIWHALLPMVALVAQTTVAIALLGLLLLVDAKLAITVGAVLITAYGVILAFASSFLARMGVERDRANETRFNIVSEAFDAFKEIKLGGLENAYSRQFSASSEIYARHQASAQIVALLPRYLLEAIAFGGMLLLILVLLARGGDFAAALPIVALYAFAGYRLMPALQQIYQNASLLRYASSALDGLHADLRGLFPYELNLSLDKKPIQFKELIQLKNIQFTHSNASRYAISEINMKIPVHSKIGLVGVSGSGKTSLVDVLLGLLDLQQGTIEVDGKVINADNLRSWQRCIGYVPQQIYLSDTTIASNIAFGVEVNEVNWDELERAAKLANLHEFVINELPNGYLTVVGERGVRLSGGQRQRIGIARALYNKPSLLVFDEATSALDTLTEHAVMDAVNNLGMGVTIILIAHRLSTVRQCDQIYIMKEGRIVAQGTYDELVEKNIDFRLMVTS